MLGALGSWCPGDEAVRKRTRDPGKEDSSGSRLGPGVWGQCIHSQSRRSSAPAWGLPPAPHIARLPAPSGDGAPEKVGKDTEADCRPTVMGSVYSGICEVTLFSTWFQRTPGTCGTSVVPPYICTWASHPQASGSSDGCLLTNSVIVGLTSQIVADSFLGESTAGAELEPAALGPRHSDVICNCGRAPSLGESSRQQ